MEIRYHWDGDRDLPHVAAHGVDEGEVADVLRRPVENLPGERNSRIVIGRTAAGRLLVVICVPDNDGDGVFVVTAYDLAGKPLQGAQPSHAQARTTTMTAKSTRTRTRARQGAGRKGPKRSNGYPKGWDARSIKALAAHYDNQSEDDAVAEHEAAYRSTLVTMMAIPVELVPKVQKLLAKRAG